MHSIFRKKNLIVLSLFQYKYRSEYRTADGFNGSGRELNH